MSEIKQVNYANVADGETDEGARGEWLPEDLETDVPKVSLEEQERFQKKTEELYEKSICHWCGGSLKVENFNCEVAHLEVDDGA